MSAFGRAQSPFTSSPKEHHSRIESEGAELERKSRHLSMSSFRTYSDSAVPISETGVSKTPLRILGGINFPRREFLRVARGPVSNSSVTSQNVLI